MEKGESVQDAKRAAVLNVLGLDHAGDHDPRHTGLSKAMGWPPPVRVKPGGIDGYPANLETRIEQLKKRMSVLEEASTDSTMARLAARTGTSGGRLQRADQDNAGEQRDPEGPEEGA